MNRHRTVMCVGTWPEDNYADFEVCDVRPGESDQDAINRAIQLYGPNQKFYIKELNHECSPCLHRVPKSPF